MTNPTFTSTAGSGYVYADHQQVEQSLEDGTLGINTADITATSATINGALTINGKARTPVVALTDGATIAVDVSTSNMFTLAIGGDRTLSNPTNLEAGDSWQIEVTQDATGGRTLTFDTNYTADENGLTLSTNPSAVDVLSFASFDGTNVRVTISRQV